jgi:hypothetical protein
MRDRGQHTTGAQNVRAPVEHFGAGHCRYDAQIAAARNADLDRGQHERDAHSKPASVNQLANGHIRTDAHPRNAVGNPFGAGHVDFEPQDNYARVEVIGGQR